MPKRTVSDYRSDIRTQLDLDETDLLHGLLYDYLIHKLQLVLNSAARLVTLMPKANYITPILRKLHWLPDSARID